MISFRAAVLFALVVASALAPVPTGAAQSPGFDHSFSTTTGR